MVDRASIKKIKLKNGSDILVNDFSLDTSDKLIISGRSHGKNSGKMYGSKDFPIYNYATVDHLDQFKRKKEGLHDILKDGDGLRKDEVRDLVLTANKAILQENSSY